MYINFVAVPKHVVRYVHYPKKVKSKKVHHLKYSAPCIAGSAGPFVTPLIRAGLNINYCIFPPVPGVSARMKNSTSRRDLKNNTTSVTVHPPSYYKLLIYHVLCYHRENYCTVLCTIIIYCTVLCNCSFINLLVVGNLMTK